MAHTVLDALPVNYRKFEKAIIALSKLVKQRNLFPSGHPSLRHILDGAYRALNDMFDNKESICLRLEADSIYYLNFEKDLVKSQDSTLQIFRTALQEMSVYEINFKRGVKEDELMAFVEIASSAIQKDKTFDFASAWVRIRNIHIRHKTKVTGDFILPPVPEMGESRELVKSADMPPVKAEGKMGKVLGGVLKNLNNIKSLEGKKAGKKILDILEDEGRNSSIVLLLSALESYDDYTFAHSVNVAILSSTTARYMNASIQEVDDISFAALMHDIGKLYVPKEIIHKRGRLTPLEWQQVKKHPVYGKRILREERVDMITRRVAYEHHVRYDMAGYPSLKPGYKLIKASHLVRIADSYDALTTRRPYRRQISPYEAVRLMARSRGSEFHPLYFDGFMQLLGNIPIGSILELESGEMVLVVDIGKGDGQLPRVRVIKDASGSVAREEIILDLNEIDPRTRRYRYAIKDVVDDPVRDVNVGKYLVTEF